MTFSKNLAALLTATIALSSLAYAKSPQTHDTPRPAVVSPESAIRDKVNAGTLGLAGGLLEGAPIRFATEIARIVNEGGSMHVLPIVTRGPTENVNDLLYLRGDRCRHHQQ